MSRNPDKWSNGGVNTDTYAGSVLLNPKMTTKARDYANQYQVEINPEPGPGIEVIGSDGNGLASGSGTLRWTLDLSAYTMQSNDIIIAAAFGDGEAVAGSGFVHNEQLTTNPGWYLKDVDGQFGNNYVNFKMIGAAADMGSFAVILRGASPFTTQIGSTAGTMQTHYKNSLFTTTSTPSTDEATYGYDGGLHLIGCIGTDTATITPPTGYTLLESSTTGYGYGIYYKVLKGGEAPLAQQFTLSASRSGRVFSLVVPPKQDRLRLWDGEDDQTMHFRISGNEGIVKAEQTWGDLKVLGQADFILPSSYVTKNANQSIDTGTDTQITMSLNNTDWEGGISWNDANDMFQLEHGLYLIRWKVRWDGVAGGFRRIWIEDTSNVISRASEDEISGTGAVDIECSTIYMHYDPSSTAFITFWVRHNQGAAMNVLGNGGQDQTVAQIVKLGRLF